jgi:2,5-diketo-D-gluconate reductase A
MTPAYALSVVEGYVKELGVEQLDLVVIHFPDTTSNNQAVWRGLEQAVAKNLTRAIGLSNFGQSDIESILKIATIRPAVNQCPMRVGYIGSFCGLRDASIAYNQAQNITFSAWSPVKMCPVTNPGLVAIATAHSKSPVQVCLRWLLDRGLTFAVGTGSDPLKAAEYSKEDLDIYDFRLTSEELKTLNAIQH